METNNIEMKSEVIDVNCDEGIHCLCSSGFVVEHYDRRTYMQYSKIIEDAIEPTCGTTESAGYDLYVPNGVEDIIIPADSTVLVDIGIAIKLPKYTFGAIFARSGLSIKQGLGLANGVGVIDSDYRGSIGVALHNNTKDTKIVKAGERIAQLIVIPYIPIKFDEVEYLDETERGNNGFGSTGK